MIQKEIRTIISEGQPSELPEADRLLIDMAREATTRAYAPYSRFNVGAAVLLINGETIVGCNQENAAFGVSICAERTALFASGARFPGVPITAIAIAARDASGHFTSEPVTPCGSCRQAMVETETRAGRPLRILLYGSRCVYVIEGIRALMPLSFTLH